MWRMSYMYSENEDGSWSNAVTGEVVFTASKAEELGMPRRQQNSKEEDDENKTLLAASCEVSQPE